MPDKNGLPKDRDGADQSKTIFEGQPMLSLVAAVLRWKIYYIAQYWNFIGACWQ